MIINGTSRRCVKLSLLVVGVLSLVLLGLAIAGDRGLPAVEGILNFGKVNNHLYRGAEPHASGVKNLKKLGVAIIIDLRMPKEISPEEETEARADGVTYTNIPLAGLGRPTDEQVARVLAVIDTSSSPVFVHCEYGCDRTGTIIACYRIRHDQWTGEAALKEAELYGLSRFERGMRAYIADCAKSANAKK